MIGQTGNGTTLAYIIGGRWEMGKIRHLPSRRWEIVDIAWRLYFNPRDVGERSKTDLETGERFDPCN